VGGGRTENIKSKKVVLGTTGPTQKFGAGRAMAGGCFIPPIPFLRKGCYKNSHRPQGEVDVFALGKPGELMGAFGFGYEKPNKKLPLIWSGT